MLTDEKAIHKKRKYYYNNLPEEKAKLKFDGKHCGICRRDLTGRQRKYCSSECYAEWYDTIEVHSWAVIKARAIERDGHVCRKCGVKEVVVHEAWADTTNLVVHHVIPIKDGGAEFDVNNCITLCGPCHKEMHRGKAVKALAECRRLDKCLNSQNPQNSPV